LLVFLLNLQSNLGICTYQTGHHCSAFGKYYHPNIGKNWQKLAKIGKNWQKLAKIGKNWQKLAKIQLFIRTQQIT
jgi:hypothetical protein